MQKSIFDARRHALIKARADRSGADSFLLERAFQDALERVTLAEHRTIAIVGRHRPAWLEMFEAQGVRALAIDPHAIESGDADRLADDRDIGDLLGQCSLVLSLGLLDHCNDPKLAAFLLGQMLAPGGILVGSIVGGESLRLLRTVMLELDRAGGRAAGRFHPMMNGQSLAGLFGDAGLQRTVIDVDRLTVRYRNLGHLVSDLRDMGCTRTLASSSTPLSPSAWRRTMVAMLGDPIEERFDLINFTAQKADG
ncbi:MAG: methyltransferase domain-containing protein [Sphingomicrobium sp.]